MPRSPAQIEAHRERLDHFAELLSLDLEIPVIAQRMGIRLGAAHNLLATLRAKYGRQAT